MNPMNDEIERTLASQPLRRPPRGLDDRIGAALAQQPAAHANPVRRSRWWLPAIAATAAGIALAFVLLMAGTHDRPAPEEVAHAPEQGARGGGRAIVTPGEPAPPDELAEAPPESLAGASGGGAMWVERVWSYTEPGELFLLDEYTPMRPIHQHTVEQVSWYDESANVRIEVTRPRDEVYYVRVPVY